MVALSLYEEQALQRGNGYNWVLNSHLQIKRLFGKPGLCLSSLLISVLSVSCKLVLCSRTHEKTKTFRPRSWRSNQSVDDLFTNVFSATLLFFNFYRISFSFKVSRNYKTGCLFWELFVRRLTRWISQVISVKLRRYLLFKVFSLDKLFSVKAQSFSSPNVWFFWVHFHSAQTAYLTFPNILWCFVQCKRLVWSWKIHLPPSSDCRSSWCREKASWNPLFEDIDSGNNYKRFSSFDFRWTINHVSSL